MVWLHLQAPTADPAQHVQVLADSSTQVRSACARTGKGLDGTLAAPRAAPCSAASSSAEYADCFIDPGALPVEALQGADLLVTGTLGLAYPMTADAMHRSVELARSSGKCQVQQNCWRPPSARLAHDCRSIKLPGMH